MSVPIRLAMNGMTQSAKTRSPTMKLAPTPTKDLRTNYLRRWCALVCVRAQAWYREHTMRICSSALGRRYLLLHPWYLQSPVTGADPADLSWPMIAPVDTYSSVVRYQEGQKCPRMLGVYVCDLRQLSSCLCDPGKSGFCPFTIGCSIILIRSTMTIVVSPIWFMML